jgi:transposase-like protein
VPISATNPFKGRQYPGEVILQAVRWCLRYPLVYEDVAELLAERGSKWMPVVSGVGFKPILRS